MHKTGTSSIQASLHGGLLGADYRYADLGKANHSGIICAAMQRDGNGLLADNPSLGELRRALSDNTWMALIISGEGICRLDVDQLRALRDVLTEYVDTVKVVAYVRPPLGYIESAFQQRLKSNDLSLADALDSYPHYRIRFEKFDRIFGRENVDLWKFDPRCFPSRCVVRDFCSRLGLDFPPERVVRVNDGLSRQAVALLYAYRKFGRGGADPILSKRFERGLVDRLTQIPGPKLRFSPAVLGSVLQDHADDIRWMENRLGAGLTEDAADETSGVNDEEDLLQVEPSALGWLASQLGTSAPRGESPTDARQVAGLVRLLVDKLAVDTLGRTVFGEAGGVDTSESSLRQRVLNAMRAARGAVVDLPERDATALVREVFRQLAREIDGMEDGVLTIEALGQFRVLKARPGKGAGTANKRVAFRGLVARQDKGTALD